MVRNQQIIYKMLIKYPYMLSFPIVNKIIQFINLKFPMQHKVEALQFLNDIETLVVLFIPPYLDVMYAKFLTRVVGENKS